MAIVRSKLIYFFGASVQQKSFLKKNLFVLLEVLVGLKNKVILIG